MLHVYNAEMGEKTFQFSVTLATPITQLSFEEEMAKVFDETSSSMLKELSGQDRLCCSCQQAEAARLLHHPMLFPSTFPPRIQDIPLPVCGNPECALQAEAQFKMDMEVAHAAEGQASSPCCFKCGKKGNAKRPLLRCSKCKVAKYCSPECQKGDWFIHKKVCVAAEVPSST